MKSRDLLLSIGAAALTAFFLPPTLQEKGVNLLSVYPTYYIYVGYTTVAIAGMAVTYYIGKKIVILWQLAKFGLVGVLNTAIDFGILNYLSSLSGVDKGLELVPIKAASFTVALVNSYWWNKNWVFEGKKRANPVTFAVISVIGISINIAIVVIITGATKQPEGTTPQVWLNLANLVATFASLTWNFLGYRLIVFKK